MAKRKQAREDAMTTLNLAIASLSASIEHFREAGEHNLELQSILGDLVDEADKLAKGE